MRRHARLWVYGLLELYLVRLHLQQRLQVLLVLSVNFRLFSSLQNIQLYLLLDVAFQKQVEPVRLVGIKVS